MGDENDMDDLLEDLGAEEDVGGNEEAVEVDQLEDMLKYASVKEIAHLMRSEAFAEHIQKVDELLSVKRESPSSALSLAEYDAVVDSNKILTDIETEIRKVVKFIRDHYALKFPELESLVQDPVLYAKVVQIVKNEMDTTNVNLNDILPAHTVMVVNVTASTTNGKPLTEEELGKVLEACQELVDLNDARAVILQYVQDRMDVLAPNISAIIGTALAAQLIGVAGGLDKLAAMPANIVQLLGKERKGLLGFSAGATATHAGFVMNCDLVKREVDLKMKRKVAHAVALKATLAARMDASTAYTPNVDSKAGEVMRAEIEHKIARWKEPPPPKQIKPLPAPDDRPKKHRAGRKARAAKARYAVTDIARASNRIEFAGDGDELVQQSGRAMGMLGKLANSGLVRLRAETKVKSKRAKLRHEQENEKNKKNKESSGLSSSLIFTPVQGMELMAPPPPKRDINQSKYFSQQAGFKTPTAQTPQSIWSSSAKSSTK